MEHQKAAKQFLHLERTRHYILAVGQNISVGTMSILFIGPLYLTNHLIWQKMSGKPSIAYVATTPPLSHLLRVLFLVRTVREK